MSVRTFYSRRGQRELLDVRTENSSSNEGQEKGFDCCEEFSRCQACSQEFDVLLILPCSHFMCHQCVTAGDGLKSSDSCHRSAALPVCAVWCPSCRHPVELPCWNWSSATSCLPTYPILSPVQLNMERAHEDHLQQEDTDCQDAGDLATHSCLHSFKAPSSSRAPVDGAADLTEEEMALSVYGLCFALDPSSVPPSLHLSNSLLTVTYRGERLPRAGGAAGNKVTSDPGVVTAPSEVCADVIIARGQYYWEVDVCNSSVYRIGVRSVDGSGGCWLQREGSSFCAVYDGSRELLYTVPPQIKTIGMFLNIGGRVLSFHNPVTQEHLATLPTRFSPAGVLPALSLGQGRLRLRCGLPPPPHVFLSKDSAYRGRCGAGGGWWRRDIPFKSVRKVIQKFEELALSDSDSGFLSSFGSSCSTLTSLPDLGIPGSVPSE